MYPVTQPFCSQADIPSGIEFPKGTYRYICSIIIHDRQCLETAKCPYRAGLMEELDTQWNSMQLREVWSLGESQRPQVQH